MDFKRTILFAACLIWGTLAMAGEVEFVRDVRPIFEKHCYECHGEAKQESGLRLDIKSLALQGGDNHGPDILPARPMRVR